MYTKRNFASIHVTMDSQQMDSQYSFVRLRSIDCADIRCLDER